MMTPTSGTAALIARQRRADEVLRVERLRAGRRRAARGRCRGRARSPGCRARAARSARATASSTDSRSTPGIDGDRLADRVAVDQEQRPDQVVDGQRRSRAPAAATSRCAGCGASAGRRGWRPCPAWSRGRRRRAGVRVSWSGRLCRDSARRTIPPFAVATGDLPLARLMPSDVWAGPAPATDAGSGNR